MILQLQIHLSLYPLIFSHQLGCKIQQFLHLLFCIPSHSRHDLPRLIPQIPRYPLDLHDVRGGGRDKIEFRVEPLPHSIHLGHGPGREGIFGREDEELHHLGVAGRGGRRPPRRRRGRWRLFLRRLSFFPQFLPLDLDLARVEVVLDLSTDDVGVRSLHQDPHAGEGVGAGGRVHVDGSLDDVQYAPGSFVVQGAGLSEVVEDQTGAGGFVLFGGGEHLHPQVARVGVGGKEAVDAELAQVGSRQALGEIFAVVRRHPRLLQRGIVGDLDAGNVLHDQGGRGRQLFVHVRRPQPVRRRWKRPPPLP
mmetsp:Transcript_30492/g.69806  ORF Transcript_30492/g.69806 Transcript_30492/m.69806 type:complete len:306 (+) Transcript_30492:389-1306(+)